MKERKAFFKKNKGLVKRLFTFVLAIALVLNMGQLMPGSTVNAAEASGTHVTLHFYNGNWNWGAPAIQYWGGTSTAVSGYDAGPTEITGWGGAQGYTLAAEGDNWYSITLKGDFEGFQFLDMSNPNNNTGGKGFNSYMTQYAGETAQNLYYKEGDSSWYLDAAYTTALQAPADAVLYNVTIHYNNLDNWTNVSCYAWTGAGTLTAGWPGDAATVNADHEGWYDYSFTGLTTANFSFIMNGNEGQTADLAASLTAGDNELWVEGGAVLATAPESWTTTNDDTTGDDTTGDDTTEDDTTPVEPTTYDAVIHYYNNLNWDAVAFYAWNSAGTPLVTWPGTVLSANVEKENWYDATVADFNEATISVIFNNNNNGSQTADLTVDLTAGEEFWIVNGEVLTTAPNAWTGEGEAEKPYELTFHYDNAGNYNGVNFYSWTAGTNAGSWPGVAMTENPDHEGWYDYKVTGVAATAIDFILNSNGAQTADLNVDISSKPSEVWVTGTFESPVISLVEPESWTEKEEEEVPEEPVEPEVYELTFHYENKNGWAAVNFYSWTAGTNTGNWPGAQMTPNEEKSGWYDFTVTNVSASAIDFILNYNGVQTADLNVDISAKPTEVWVSGYYTSPVITTTAPEAWTNPQEDEERPSSYDVVVHYKNVNNWSNVSMYSWNGGGNALLGSWPGTLASANTANTGWYDFYMSGLTDSVFNFIWNNGGAGSQTSDLVYNLTEEFTELWVVGEDISTTAPTGWTNTYAVKLHYNNPNNWSNVYLYAWDGNNNNPAGGWPGALATANESNEGWYDYYVEGVTSATFNHIWNNNSGSQTSDLNYVLSRPYTELWVVGETVTAQTPDTWSDKAPVKEREVYVPGTLPGPAWDAASNKMEYLGNGIYAIIFENLPAANYEYKIAIGGSWDENYGANGAGNGANIKLCVPVAQDVTIYYSDVTHLSVNSIDYIFADIALTGTNVPEGTGLSDEGLTGIYNVTVTLPAGTYSDLQLVYDGKTYTFGEFVLAKEKDVTFCMDPVSGLFYHDGSDTKVDASALYFDSKSLEYKSVFGAVATGEEVKFSLTTGTDVTSASLFFKGMENKALAMSKDGDAVDGKQKWSVTATLSAIGEYDYYFAVSNGADVCVYGDDDGYYGTGKTSGLTDVMPYDLVVYKAGFTTPDWMKNGVIYQIFPDRFFDGDSSNNKAQLTARGAVDYEFIEDWSAIPENPEQEALLDKETYESTGAFWGDGQWSNEIYGGDLEGITQRIDYLKALGVTVIYLNPVFSSISSHRYDACDYTEIDPILGTEGDFTELVRIAEKNGMTVVLDGVFNHVSDDSIYFDRYYKFLDDGLDTIGAYPYWAYVYDYMTEKGADKATAEAAAKQYFTENYGVTDYSFVEWFEVYTTALTDENGTPVYDTIGDRTDKPVYGYEGWWGYDSMPVIKSTNGSEYQTGNWAEQIIYNEEGTSVTQYWISKGMDGWRLDVANEVSDETWQAFRESVKSLDSEAVIIGEIWDDATKYILGDMYDSVMNYQFRNAVTSFAMGSDAETITKQMERIRERYPQEAFYAMMNLVGSHDTSRILSYLDGVGDDRSDKSIEAAFPSYEGTSALAKQRQYLVAFLQFTYAGAPTIYYGDEVGVVGGDDPDDRRTFPWGEGEEDLVTYYAKLAQIRKAYSALRTGSVEPISTGNASVMGYVRADEKDTVVVLANNSQQNQTVTLDVAALGITAEQLQDMLGVTVYEVEDGKVTVVVPAIYGVILVEEVKAIYVDVDALAPAFDEEAAKRPTVKPTPTPTPSPAPTPDVDEDEDTDIPQEDTTPENDRHDDNRHEENAEEGRPEEMPEEGRPEEPKPEEDKEDGKPEKEDKPGKDVPKSEKPFVKYEVSSEDTWNDVMQKIMESKGEANLQIKLSGYSQVPGDFIQSLAGQDVDVVFEMGNGITWTLSSDTVTGKAVDVDFHVDVNSHNIPTDVVEELAEDKTVVQLSLAHSGEFGCQPVLTLQVGNENAGKYANLFYYNEKTGVMEFMTYGLIDAEGNADLQFIHASEYAVVIDTQIMGATIGDVEAPLGDITTGPSPIIFVVIIACIAVGALAICYGLRKKEDRA